MSDEELYYFLFEVFYNSVYGKTNYLELPNGYKPLITLLDFEQHSDNDCWAAVYERSPDKIGFIAVILSFLVYPSKYRSVLLVLTDYVECSLN